MAEGRGYGVIRSVELGSGSDDVGYRVEVLVCQHHVRPRKEVIELVRVPGPDDHRGDRGGRDAAETARKAGHPTATTDTAEGARRLRRAGRRACAPSNRPGQTAAGGGTGGATEELHHENTTPRTTDA
jgi:hypothetical protein